VKKLVSIFLCLTMLCVPIPLSAKGLAPEQISGKEQSIQKLKTLSNGNLKLSEKDGQIFLSGKLANKQVAGEKSATNFLEENKLIFGIDSTTNDLKTIDVKKDAIGDTYVRFVQVINGIKVNNSLIIVHFDKNGIIVSVNGKLEKDKSITILGNKTISESEAVEIAKKQYTYKSLRNTPKAEKIILNKDNKNYETYKINISYMEPTIANYDVYVESHSGKVIQTESNIRYDGPTTGSGIDVLGNVKDLNLYESGSSYQMRDMTNSDTIATYSLNHGTSSGFIVSNNFSFFGTEDYKASVSAHYNASKVTEFYKNLFDRNSLDNNGMMIKSFTHYGYNYNNAFWDGYEMIYGDGDGTNFTYLSGDLDVVGHEMTHGVISNTANLSYHNESGALNESMADVFGILIETYNKYNIANGGNWTFNAADWVIGDDIYTPYIPGDALRSLSNPTLYGQPDNMTNYANSADTQNGDWGGVHTNSGITNKAAYLVAKSIGMKKTAEIYYRALVTYMSPDTGFEQAENCLAQAATDLYGQDSAEVAAVNNAFYSVGVGQPPVVNVSSVSLNKNTSSLEIGDTDTLTATINPIDATNKNVTWTSSDNSVATVDNAGNVNAVSAGTTTITATTVDGGKSDTCTVTVNNPIIKVTSVSLNKNTDSLVVGSTDILSATVAPIDATNKNVTWTSSDNSVATVDNAGNVNAVSAGTTTITATTVDGSKIDTCTVTVNNPIIKVTSVSLNKTTDSLVVGSTDTLSATVAPIDATNKDVTWTSLNPAIVTVDNAGNVNAVSVGTTTITATTVDGSKIDTCTVTVNNPIIKVISVSLNKITDSLVAGGTDTLIASINPIDAANKNITWTSSDNSVATVDNAGNVNAVSAGTTTITATTVDGSKIDTCTVTVNNPIIKVTSVSLNKTTDSLVVGNTDILSATVAPIDATNKNITWASSNTSVATVDSTGKVTAIGNGSATITVTTIDGNKTASCTVTVTNSVVKSPSVSYQGQVQNIGWQSWVNDGALSGTEGSSLRVEAFRIKLENVPAGLKIKYKTHVQNIGWQDWVYDGAMAGTEGQSLRVEALQIVLEGIDADKYSIEYQAHVQNEGWQPWVRDGQIAGSFGKSQRVEALRIKITEKLPSVSYQGQVQNIGWQSWVNDGALSGTEGRSLRVEAFRIKLENAPAGLKIKYKTHVQNIGWQDWVYDGVMAGTEGQSLRVEALQIMLEGTDAYKYSIEYQAYVQNEGWEPWVSDGQTTGSLGKSQRIEALRVVIFAK